MKGCRETRHLSRLQRPQMAVAGAEMGAESLVVIMREEKIGLLLSHSNIAPRSTALGRIGTHEGADMVAVWRR